jgi:hypothetical protein
LRFEGRAERKDAVFVGLAEGRVAGVEGGWNFFAGEDADGVWEAMVEGALEVDGGDGRGEGEAGDLGESVDAGVSATGALGQNALSGDAEEGVGEQTLDGRQDGLDLPAVVGRAVVGEDELEVGHVGGARYKVQGKRRRLVYLGIPGESAADGKQMERMEPRCGEIRSRRYAAVGEFCSARGVISAAFKNRDPAGARLKS